MLLEAIRQGYNSDQHWSRKTFDAGIVVNRVMEHKYIEIGFSTNPEGLRRQSYSIVLTPSQFRELAQLMMQAPRGAS